MKRFLAGIAMILAVSLALFGCGAGQTIQSQVDAAQPGDTIMISGTCNEAVVVNGDDLILDGGGSAVIDGAGLNRWAIDVTGRQKVTIRGLTVRNAHAGGIVITETSGVWMQDVTVRDTRFHSEYDTDGHGIFVGHASSVVMTGAIVADDNAGSGITVWQSGNILAISRPASRRTATARKAFPWEPAARSPLSATWAKTRPCMPRTTRIAESPCNTLPP